MLTKAKKKHTGDFKHFVEFQFIDGSGDGMGGSTGEWEKLTDMWCRITPVSGSQKLHLDAIQSNVSHIIEMDYRSDIDFSNENRIAYNGRTFNIHYVLVEDEENCFYQLAATEET